MICARTAAKLPHCRSELVSRGAVPIGLFTSGVGLTRSSIYRILVKYCKYWNSTNTFIFVFFSQDIICLTTTTNTVVTVHTTKCAKKFLPTLSGYIIGNLAAFDFRLIDHWMQLRCLVHQLGLGKLYSSNFLCKFAKPISIC